MVLQVGAAREKARTQATLFALGLGFSATHSMQLGTLMASIAAATQDLSAAFSALLILLAIEPFTELLTGHYADRYGRRRSVTLGFWTLALAGIGFLALTGPLSQSPNLVLLIGLSQLVYLLGNSLISGALEAWAVDRLKAFGGTHNEFDGVFAGLVLYKNIGLILGGGLGILLLTWTAQSWAPWLVFMIANALLGAAAWRRMHETGWTGARRVDGMGLWTSLLVLVRRCRGSANLSVYVLAWALQYGLWVALAYFWVPLLLVRLDAAPMQHWGWAVAAWFVWCGVRIASAAATVWIVRTGRLAVEPLITFCAVAAVVPVLGYLALAESLAPMERLVWFFVALLLSKVFEVALTGLRMARLNRSITDDELRATFLSVSTGAGAAIGALTLGLAVLLIGEIPSDPRQLLQALLATAVIALSGVAVYASQRSRR